MVATADWEFFWFIPFFLHFRVRVSSESTFCEWNIFYSHKRWSQYSTTSIDSRYISDQSGCNRRIWHYPTAAYFLNCKLRRALFHFKKKTLIFKVVVRFFVENPFCQIPLIALLSKRISVSICRCQSLWNWDGDASNNWKEWDGIRALVSVVCCWLDTVPHKCKLLTFSERWAMIKKEPLLDWRHCRMGKE